MEIYKFELGATMSWKKSVRIITNMLNRIIVMMDEELLFCEVERYVLLREYIQKLMKIGKMVASIWYGYVNVYMKVEY